MKLRACAFQLIVTSLMLWSDVSGATVRILFQETTSNPERTDLPIKVTVDTGGQNPATIPGCTGSLVLPCVSSVVNGATNESTAVEVFLKPADFPNLTAPAGGVATSYLTDPDQTTFSDRFDLEVFPSQYKIKVTFTSDTDDPSGFGRRAGGFKFFAVETAPGPTGLKPADVTNNFFTGTVENPKPYLGYPAGLVIQGISDVDPVPEPSGMLLMALGLSALGVRISSQLKRR